MYNKNKLTFLYGLQKKNEDKICKTLDEELVYRKKLIFDESFIYPLAVTIQAIAISFNNLLILFNDIIEYCISSNSVNISFKGVLQFCI